MAGSFASWRLFVFNCCLFVSKELLSWRKTQNSKEKHFVQVKLQNDVQKLLSGTYGVNIGIHEKSITFPTIWKWIWPQNPSPLRNFLGHQPLRSSRISNSLRGRGLDIFWKHTIIISILSIGRWEFTQQPGGQSDVVWCYSGLKGIQL